MVIFIMGWQMNTMGFIEDFTDGLNSLVGRGRKFENPHQLAQKLGKSSSQIKRYLEGERTKHLGAIGEILDILEFKLLRPGESAPSLPSKDDLAAVRDMVTRILCEHDVDGQAIKAVNKAMMGIEDKRHKRRAAGEN